MKNQELICVKIKVPYKIRPGKSTVSDRGMKGRQVPMFIAVCRTPTAYAVGFLAKSL